MDIYISMDISYIIKNKQVRVGVQSESAGKYLMYSSGYWRWSTLSPQVKNKHIIVFTNFEKRNLNTLLRNTPQFSVYYFSFALSILHEAFWWIIVSDRAKRYKHIGKCRKRINQTKCLYNIVHWRGSIRFHIDFTSPKQSKNQLKHRVWFLRYVLEFS